MKRETELWLRAVIFTSILFLVGYALILLLFLYPNFRVVVGLVSLFVVITVGFRYWPFRVL